MTHEPDNSTEQLSAYLDGELAADQVVLLESRLAAEPALRQELEELAEVKRMVGSLPRMAAPAGVAQAVREQLERRTLLPLSPAPAAMNEPPLWLRLVRITAAAAVVMLSAGVVFLVANHAIRPAPVAIHEPERRAQPIGPSMDRLAADDLGRRIASKTGPDARFDPDGSQLAAKGGHEESLSNGKLAREGDVLRKEAAKHAAAAAPVVSNVGVAEGSIPDDAKQADGRNLDDRLAKADGLPGDELLRHNFDNEPVVIDCPVDNATDQRNFRAKLMNDLASNGAVVVRDDNARNMQINRDSQVAIVGKAGRNYTASDEQQEVLAVRARRSVVDKVILAEANRQTQNNAVVLERGDNRGREPAGGWQAKDSGYLPKASSDRDTGVSQKLTAKPAGNTYGDVQDAGRYVQGAKAETGGGAGDLRPGEAVAAKSGGSGKIAGKGMDSPRWSPFDEQKQKNSQEPVTLSQMRQDYETQQRGQAGQQAAPTPPAAPTPVTPEPAKTRGTDQPAAAAQSAPPHAVSPARSQQTPLPPEVAPGGPGQAANAPAHSAYDKLGKDITQAAPVGVSSAPASQPAFGLDRAATTQADVADDWVTVIVNIRVKDKPNAGEMLNRERASETRPAAGN